jgi:hypothetical protein
VRDETAWLSTNDRGRIPVRCNNDDDRVDTIAVDVMERS